MSFWCVAHGFVSSGRPFCAFEYWLRNHGLCALPATSHSRKIGESGWRAGKYPVTSVSEFTVNTGTVRSTRLNDGEGTPMPVSSAAPAALRAWIKKPSKTLATGWMALT